MASFSPFIYPFPSPSYPCPVPLALVADCGSGGVPLGTTFFWDVAEIQLLLVPLTSP